MDFEQARFNMIEQQIRPWEVLDQRTLDAFSSIHREDFMPAAYRQLALADVNIPIGHDQVTMTPKVEGRMLQSLAIEPGQRVLEVGTGCGFVTALLASHGGAVVSVELFADFTEAARPKLARCGLPNVTLHSGDACRGWPTDAPYDAIAVTGSVPVLSDDFERQLAVGGRLFVIVGAAPVMEAMLITRLGESEWSREPLFETELPPLHGLPEPSRFRF
ncbi:MAG: protein-L-isoaspartate O-methyltransferase [Gammaproteobacteria bacterium]|nr:protein-L-isoaspartate O-methyltransferase [Gammaproteobacteria bacterium]